MGPDYHNQDLLRRSFSAQSLEAANFAGADLTGADFTGTMVGTCDSSGAVIDGVHWEPEHAPFPDSSGNSTMEQG